MDVNPQTVTAEELATFVATDTSAPPKWVSYDWLVQVLGKHWITTVQNPLAGALLCEQAAELVTDNPVARALLGAARFNFIRRPGDADSDEVLNFAGQLQTEIESLPEGAHRSTLMGWMAYQAGVFASEHGRSKEAGQYHRATAKAYKELGDQVREHISIFLAVVEALNNALIDNEDVLDRLSTLNNVFDLTWPVLEPVRWWAANRYRSVSSW